MPALPREPHDAGLDFIVTEREVIRTGRIRE
jgi:5-formyltetrahydrofolate cyclo-ligase